MTTEYWVLGDDDVLRLFCGRRLLGQVRWWHGKWVYSTETAFGSAPTIDDGVLAIMRALGRRPDV